jgi:hypothetical protein
MQQAYANVQKMLAQYGATMENIVEVNLCGHEHFDMQAYMDYQGGETDRHRVQFRRSSHGTSRITFYWLNLSWFMRSVSIGCGVLNRSRYAHNMSPIATAIVSTSNSERACSEILSPTAVITIITKSVINA